MDSPGMGDQEERERLARLLDEIYASSTPLQVGPHYPALVALIQEELNVAFAMDRFGDVAPEPNAIRVVAELIAAEIDIVYAVTPKRPPPQAE